MGNCMETCLPRQQQQEEEDQDKLHGDIDTTTTYPQNPRPVADEEEEVQGGVFSEDNSNKEVSEIGKGDHGGSVRVRIVLTKEELHWLMMQLKSDGEKRFENILEEIERRREKVPRDDGRRNCTESWKPSLESIMEIPELLEMNRSMRL